MKKYISYLLGVLFTLTACDKQTLNVALLIEDSIYPQSTELSALGNWLQNEEDVSYKYVGFDNIDNLSNYDIVWYHRPDTLPVTVRETEIGNALKNYVSKGGKLILSMEAVQLLNTWQIEPEQIEKTVFNAKDEGFGRKVGFHAFREHPLFDELFGGAYTWHGRTDNKCRVWGFYGEKLPLAENAKVIGTLWEYIFYHPKDKVLWETPLGQGKILAIGGFLYYGEDNFHQQILHQFSRNCLDYLAEAPMKSHSYYWENRPIEVVPQPISLDKMTINPPTLWNIPQTSESICWEATQADIDLPSRRTMLIAKEQSGIEEIWTHPFMSLRDYRVWLDLPGKDTLIALSSYCPTIELRPNAIIRTYKGEDFQLKEILTSQVNKPIVVAHYEWETGAIHKIIVDYKSNLRWMWPYDEEALGSIFYHWSEEANTFIIHDVNKEYVSLVGSNLPGKPLLAGRFDSFTYSNKQPQGIVTELLQVASSISYDVAHQQAMDLFMVAGNEGIQEALTNYTTATRNPAGILESSTKYYSDYLENSLTIITPDSLFNEGFRWANLGSAQFIVETPGIGTSLMAGYASSRRGWGGAHKVSGRPGYGWYFGRDAVWSSFALAGLGDYQTVREVLETLIRYQQVDGKIYHELTTSGSVHFDASDATPLFVNLMAHYLRASGDIEFAKRNMPAVIRAMEYCFSTDTDEDHLIEITNVGHGWLEGGALYGSHTEFYLVGLWNAALENAAYLADVTGDAVHKAQYMAEAHIVNKIINRDFWNEKGYFNYGKYKDGSYTDKLIVLTTVPIYYGVTDAERSYHTVKAFASNGFSADWGVRMIDDRDSIFHPTAYHFGSVWPLFTGWTSLAEYQSGRYNQGFSHIMANLLNYKGISRGRVPEVIHGMVYKPSGVTLHQCWSETMVLQPIIEGMLGFAPHALANRLVLAPRLPFHWDALQVKNLRMANTTLSFMMRKEQGKLLYDFSTNQQVTIDFQPAFAPGTLIKRVLINGKEIEYRTQNDKEYVTLHLEAEIEGITSIEILFEEGMSSLPAYRLSQYEEPSNGIRILSQRVINDALEIIVEGHSGSTCPINLYLPNGYSHITGVNPKTMNIGNVYTFHVDFDSKKEDKYVTRTIMVYPNK